MSIEPILEEIGKRRALKKIKPGTDLKKDPFSNLVPEHKRPVGRPPISRASMDDKLKDAPEKKALKSLTRTGGERMDDAREVVGPGPPRPLEKGQITQRRREEKEGARQFDETMLHEAERLALDKDKFQELIRQYDLDYAFRRDEFKEDTRRYDQDFTEGVRQFDKTHSLNERALTQRGSTGGGGTTIPQFGSTELMQGSGLVMEEVLETEPMTWDEFKSGKGGYYPSILSSLEDAGYSHTEADRYLQLGYNDAARNIAHNQTTDVFFDPVGFTRGNLQGPMKLIEGLRQTGALSESQLPNFVGNPVFHPNQE